MEVKISVERKMERDGAGNGQGRDTDGEADEGEE